MKPTRLARISPAILLLGCAAQTATVNNQPAVAPNPSVAADLHSRYHATASTITDAAMKDDGAYDKLRRLCDDVGNRISGSANLDRALDWAVETMQRDGLQNVHKEPVQVIRWVRGEESIEMIEPRRQPLVMLGLGGSIATPPEGITAEVVVVRDEAELDKLGSGAEGKIVLFNNAMPPYDPVKGSGYGQTVRFRHRGADLASDKGAVACLVRSVTAHSLRTPHTGAMGYADGKRKIPAAAITVEDSEEIARMTADGKKVVVCLKMTAHDEGLVPSANVIGEIRGRELPDEVVVIGGHIDSWDVGQGAHDDGAGCVMSMEALALLKRLNLTPRRTIRCVLFTNEENGLAGGKQYALDHAADLAKHVAALETDSGGFRPVSIGVSIPDTGARPSNASTSQVLDSMRRGRQTSQHDEQAAAKLAAVLTLLQPTLNMHATVGGGGADISAMRAGGVPQLGLEVEGSRYFDYHHTPADTLDKVDKKDLRECVAAMAVVSYVLADMPESLRD